jgi:hypothetical protein
MGLLSNSADRPQIRWFLAARSRHQPCLSTSWEQFHFFYKEQQSHDLSFERNSSFGCRPREWMQRIRYVTISDA